MTNAARPYVVVVFSALLALSALLTGYGGLSASGYLVPAACLLLLSVLVWFGHWRAVVVCILAANLVSEVALDLVLDFGNVLGRTKLDIAGVALLINLLCGGPFLLLLALPMLAAFRWSAPFRHWFDGSSATHPEEAA